MKEYLFTEYISQQWRCFAIMLFTGCSIGILYKNIRKYIFLRMNAKFLGAFLEVLFFFIAALFTGGIIDYCCNSKITLYMIIAFLIGIWGSGLIIRRTEETKI